MSLANSANVTGATGPAGAEDSALMRRFLALPGDKRRVFQTRAREQGIDLAGLPIPGGLRHGTDAPLSYAQQRLWVVEQLSPGTGAYNIPAAVRLHGALDVAALSQAFSAIVARHEALRTSFHEGPNGALQRVRAEVPFALDYEDWQGDAGSVADRQARVQACAQQEAVRPFALDAAPLMRARLIRLAPDEHVLLLTLHHIVADAWSMTRLVEECTRGYARLAAAGTHVAPLPDLAIQYADYAIWQRGWLEAGELERQLAYWREHIGEAHPVLPLPADRARPAVPSGRGATYVMQADAALTARLRALARTHDTTLYTVLLAAYGVWLGRISGVRDVCVGVPVAGRAKLETEPLIGFFVNTQVMRVGLDPTATFADLVATTRMRAIEAQAHADVPFDKLVEALQPARDAAVNALFQAKFNHEIARDAVPEMAGLRIEPLPVAGQSSHFDLSLDTLERGDTLQIALTYATDLFDATTVEPLARAFHRLLGQLTDSPRARLSDVALTTDAPCVVDGERRAWETGDWMDVWTSRVAQDGEALAVEGEGGAWSRRTLDGHANRVAQALASCGVGAEDRVALLMPRSAAWVAAMLGVWKLGAAYVPLDPAQPAARLAQLIDASGAKALIVAPGLASVPDVDGCRTLHSDTLLAGDAAGHEARFVSRSVHPSQAAYVIYTSGSTGQPKGVVVGRGALHNYVQGVSSRLSELPEAAGMAMVSTVAADLGHTVLFGALAMGRPLHLMPHDDAFDAGRFAQWMGARRIGVMKIVPSHLKGLLLAAGSEVLPHDWLVVGGEAADAELLALLHSHRPGLRVLNHYGPTETTVGVLTHAATSHDALLPVGAPLPNVSAYVLDDDLNAVPPGVSGELYIGGVALARGYLGEPGKTAERFVPDPWRPGARMYRTGDRVKRRFDGQIVYLGRADDQVKIRGYRVEPGEVAHALRALDGVRDAVVLVERQGADGLNGQEGREGREGQERGQPQLLGCFTGTLTHAQARTALQAVLPDAWVPARLVRVEELPLTANGKVDRRALLAAVADVTDVAAAASPSQTRAEAAPLNALEARIADVWQAVLKVGQVGRDANFFEIGGDSILALQVIARLKRGTPPLKLSLRELMQHGTVARLAAALSPSDAAPAAGGDLLVRLNHGTSSAPALFCVHPAVGTVFDYRPLAQALSGTRPVIGIQSRMLLDPKWTDTSLDEMAARYVDAMRTAQPQGPYHLLGWSLGGPIALAMAERLRASAETVAFLGLADTFVPQHEAQTASVATSRDWTGDLLDYLVTILPQVDAAGLRASLASHAGKPLDEGVLAAAVDAALTMHNGDAASSAAGDYASLGRDELAHMFRVTAHLRSLADAHRLRPAVVPVHAWWVERRAAQDRARFTRAIGAAPVYEGTVASSHMQLPRTQAWIDDVVRALSEVSPSGVAGKSDEAGAGWRLAS
ncbi:amino acid adenylation domain-containing protein [Pandoraea anhela]|uniref:Tyrocidine synthase 3 n=1 Tax=Pandoraea anhela TaxID=2508295 RepID=A0A5E4WQP6_9BURK|nr:non-ribosomal peptide synthetase [Pandoraea anhela]VVE25336.1 Tyrocidine synthase 3 [Pandoraea anhela]